MTGWRAAFLAALFLALGAASGAAQDVTLTSPDGAVEISGTLLGFDGEFYRVETVFGELTVDGSGVVCSGPGCPNLDAYVAEIGFSGSSTMAEVLLPALVEGFARRTGLAARLETIDRSHFVYHLHQGDEGRRVGLFHFRATNTDEGFADLLANEADVVMALREIRPQESARAAEAGLGDMTEKRRSRVLALDAIVPVVSASNPVREISPADLARVFAGEITSWSELGGPDAPIALHLPAERSGLSQAISDLLMAPARLDMAREAMRHAPTSALAEAVARDPFAIGLSSFAERGETRVLDLTGRCGFALSASRRAIKTEDYPLTSPMFLYLPARRLPKLARDFLDYTRSPAAQIVIRRAGFVDQAPETIPINDQGDRFANALLSAGSETGLDALQDMVRTLRPLSRLSTTFRFRPGSALLDAQSRSNVAQLAHAIETGRHDARRLVFVGFSDGEGPAAGNLEIALARAEAVRDAVVSAVETGGTERVTLDVAAFGEALPMACDDSAWGRRANRRVEVWIR